MAVMLTVGRMLGGRILGAYDKETVFPASILVLIASLVLLLFARSLPMLVLSGSLFGLGAASSSILH